MHKPSRVRALLPTCLTVALLLPGSFAIAAPSAQERAARAVETRQSALRLLGFYMAPLGAMARGRVAMDAAVVSHNAAQLAALAPMLEDTFKADTSAYKVKTEALDSIWENWDDFVAKAQDLGTQASRLAAAAASRNKAGATPRNSKALRAAIGAVGKACGGCHDVYREDD